MANVRETVGDAFSTERAGFRERLASLAGGTTWREPMEGHSTRGDHMPDVHALAASLAMARRSPNDIGPDVAYAVICQRPERVQAVVIELSAALLGAGGHPADRCADVLPMLAAACYGSVVTGRELPTSPEGVEWAAGVSVRDWLLLTGLGCGTLWDACEQAVRRAERAYRAQAA